ncbi:hypothetical protein GCM10010400_11430 [Streptomyces aculeolatus]|uniref:hypothetical protein n=1 Tax=Streptomyces aculeolatus TaxID=270689 RepID=UPI001CED20E6|nr:hypothetical protein [Streptomyces aculeolatus]
MIGRQGGVSWSEPDKKDRGATGSGPEGLDHPGPLTDLADRVARSGHARGRD